MIMTPDTGMNSARKEEAYHFFRMNEWCPLEEAEPIWTLVLDTCSRRYVDHTLLTGTLIPVWQHLQSSLNVCFGLTGRERGMDIMHVTFNEEHLVGLNWPSGAPLKAYLLDWKEKAIEKMKDNKVVVEVL